MEFAGSGSCSIRDLPPSKRFKYASSYSGSAPRAALPAKKRGFSPPPPETAAASACLPAQKRAYAPTAAEVAPQAGLPAKKRAYAPPPVDANAPACLPAKKRAQAMAPPPPVPDTTVSPFLPAKKRVYAPPPLDASSPASVCLPSNKRVLPPFIPASPPPSTKPDGAKDKESDNVSKEVRGRPPAKCKKTSKAVDPEEPNQDDEAIEQEQRKRAEGIAQGKEQREGAEQVARGAVEEEDDGVHCAVCGSTDGEPSDPIVFCDGCDLMVHATCYGNPLAQSVPAGDWFCSLCSGEPPAEASPPCCLCPASGGAMKRTTEGKWAHIACALLVPEVFFRDADGRDGVDCSRVPAHRFATECYICESSSGCALVCSQPRCGLGFHVSCGLAGGLCLEYREAKGGAVVAGFCREHTKLWEKQQLTGKYKIVSRGQE